MNNQKAVEVINGFIELKRQEKAVKETVELNKMTFIWACDTIAEGKNQIQYSDVLLYTAERKKYEYSKAILELEKGLKAAKEKFESKNEPVEVTRCWAVKL